MDRSTLERKSVGDLREIAGQLDIAGTGRMRKAQIIDAIVGEVGDDAGNGSGDGGRGEDDRQRARDEVIERRRARARSRDEDEDDGGDGDDERGDGEDRDDDGGRSRGRNRNRRRENRNGSGNGEGGGRERDDTEVREGVLDLLPEGYGFLRTTGYVAGHKDVYVSQSYVRRFGLRRGDVLGGPIRFNKGNDKFPALARLETCEGEEVGNEHDPILHDRPDVDDLTVVFPDRRIGLADQDAPAVVRVLDALAPVGHGQRVLVEAPLRAGATTLVTELARALPVVAPDAEVLAVLIDERPEEITAMRRATDVEVVASSFDRAPDDHTAVAELAVERAKRLVERGRDVVLLVDSLTTIMRAYEAQAGGGRGQSNEAAAVMAAKRLFGAGRSTEEGGSLTIVAIVRTETGHDTDELLRAALQGTSTTRVRLVPAAVHVEVFPVLDPRGTWTGRDDLLRDEDELDAASALREAVDDHDPAQVHAALGRSAVDAPDATAVLRAATDELA